MNLILSDKKSSTKISFAETIRVSNKECFLGKNFKILIIGYFLLLTSLKSKLFKILIFKSLDDIFILSLKKRVLKTFCLYISYSYLTASLNNNERSSCISNMFVANICCSW